MKKNLLLGIAIPVIIFSSCQPGQQPAQEPSVPEVSVLVLNKTDTVVYTEYPAQLEGLTDVEIRPQVNGILEKVLVQEGASVEKGKALFLIDSRPYQEVYNDAKAQLSIAQADVQTAKIEVEKLKALVDNRIVSNYQLKTAEAVYAAAVAGERKVLTCSTISLCPLPTIQEMAYCEGFTSLFCSRTLCWQPLLYPLGFYPWLLPSIIRLVSTARLPGGRCRSGCMLVLQGWSYTY